MANQAMECYFPPDSSDNDPDVRSNISKAAPAKDALGTAWLSTPVSASSTSLARDLALAADYERVHSKHSPSPAKLDLATASPAVESPGNALGPKSSQIKPSATKSEEWVMLTPTKFSNQVEKDNRVWLEPSSSEEDVTSVTLALPNWAADASTPTSGSTDTAYKSAISLPTVQIEGARQAESSSGIFMTAAEAMRSFDGPEQDDAVPTEEERDRANKIYDGNEEIIKNEKAAAWMGGEGTTRSRTLVAYMELYDFANLNILAALRIMCGRLILRAESQQVDRILDAFARRWCQCNPNHGFKVTGKILKLSLNF